MLVRFLGFKGVAILAVVGVVAYFVLPDGMKQAIFGTLGGDSAGGGASGSGSVCEANAKSGQACDFSRAVLASTEDTWRVEFNRAELPSYGAQVVQSYQEPTLVVFSGGVSTGGCGNATSAVGPFYCPADKKLYIDPSFYQTMEKQLEAPGDFAQAYVIAHEVGHHVQNLIGSSSLRIDGESKNQASVRVELQADCLAGVWGHNARADLQITEEDLREAVTAAHAIGDDALGHADQDDYTHGSSEQRIRWFRKGFERGDARQCDTFAVKDYEQL